MNSYVDQFLPTLQNTLPPTSAGNVVLKVIYIQAGPVGKSLRLVPDLWKHVKSTRPNAQGFYVVSSQIEAGLLQHVYSSTGIIEAEVDAMPQGDDLRILSIISYDSLRQLLSKDRSIAMINHRDLILFMDIEYSPSVVGEMCVSLIHDWVSQLKGKTNVTIICLAALERADIKNTYLQAGFRLFAIDWIDSPPVPERELVNEQTEISNIIRSTLLNPAEQGNSPYVVIFGEFEEIRQTYIVPLFRETGRMFDCMALRRDSSLPYVQEVFNSARPTLLCVDPSFGASVPVSNLRHVISPATKMVDIFEPSTSQFPKARIPLSDADIYHQKSWVSKALNAAGDPPVYWSSRHLKDKRSENDAPLRGQMMRLCLDASSRFESLVNAPVPAFQEVGESLISETKRRLRIIGCLADDTPMPRITPLGIRTLAYIEHQKLNPRRIFRLGNLLARIETDNTLSVPTKRVLIRMAALTCYRPLYQLQGDAADRLLEEDPVVLAAIKADSAGIGQQESDKGQLWCELGLWTKMLVDGSIMTALNMGLDFAPRAQGFMQIDVATCVRVRDYVRLLESQLGMPDAADELGETMLSDRERWHVLETLTWTYLHQLVFFPSETLKEPPNDLVSLRRVEMQSCAHPTTFLSRMAEYQLDRGGFCAIYQDVLYNGNRLVPLDLTFVPDGMMKRIRQRFGNMSLTSLIQTLYPIRGGR
ncbi:hypothetical protein F5Y13DRAFT_80554 [Hypoxylon sp. FL1857]|nr:hypothetical protein F5Y13DRAFT_80554 [Hypoxylon sp. FL1857]